MKLRYLAALILFAAFDSSANASLIVSTNPLSPTNVASVSAFATTGSDMDGMQITAFFVGGGSQTLSWADTGPGAGGVTGTGWSLTQAGDTYQNNPWTLTSNRLLTRLRINALGGSTAFDRRLPGDAVGTPGSSVGRTISSLTGDGLYQVNATYGMPIGLNNNSHGDLFGSLDLRFRLFGFPAAYFGTLTFRADTDNFTAVPEPSSITLSSIAILALCSTARRRRNGLAA